MSGLVESLLRFLRRDERDFSSLELVTVPSAAVTDDEIDAWSDLRYCRELVSDLIALSSVTPGSCPMLAEMLDRPTITDEDAFHTGLMTLWDDPVGDLLRDWAVERDDTEETAA